MHSFFLHYIFSEVIWFVRQNFKAYTLDLLQEITQEFKKNLKSENKAHGFIEQVIAIQTVSH